MDGSDAATEMGLPPEAWCPAEAGKGSGLVNACTFLGGSAGVAGGATAFALGGFIDVLAMIAIAGLIGTLLGREIPQKT